MSPSRCWTFPAPTHPSALISFLLVWLQIFGWSKKMSAIALLDVSGTDAAFSELVALARAGAAQWAVEHPGAAAPAMATVAVLPQVWHQLPSPVDGGCSTHGL